MGKERSRSLVSGDLPVATISRKIAVLRGRKVMLDADLAGLYGVRTRVLNQAVKRNRHRFPPDFMFRLSRSEVAALNRSQVVTGSQKHRDPRFLPYAFTEHGAVMLATVLNTRIAVRASVMVVRAFVHLRQAALSTAAVAHRLEELERKHAAHDLRIEEIVEAIRELAAPPPEPPDEDPIGFRPPRAAHEVADVFTPCQKNKRVFSTGVENPGRGNPAEVPARRRGRGPSPPPSPRRGGRG